MFIFERVVENYNVYKCLGILDNIKGEKRVEVSFHDKVTALHQDFLALEADAGKAGHKERTVAMKQQRRADFGGVPAGSMMQLWSLASRSGDVWNLLLRIITRDVTPPPQLKHGKSRGGKRKTTVKTVNSAASARLQ